MRSPVITLLRYIWASPNSLIGLLFVPLAMLRKVDLQIAQ